MEDQETAHTALAELAQLLGSQRAAARALGVPHRELWGWLAREHKMRPRTEQRVFATLARTNELSDARGAVLLRASVTPGAPALVRGLIARAPTNLRPLPALDEPTTEPSSFGPGIPLENFGQRFGSGALSRPRP